MIPSAHHIANFIVQGYGEKFGGFTNMKLQKVLYYIKAWGLVADCNPIKEQFCHWQYGPVIREVWQEYKKFGKQPVEGDAALPTPELTHEQRDLVEMIVYSYGRLSAFTLSDLTHSEDPWKNTAKGDVIDDAVILAYYSDEAKNPFARNFPISKDAVFTSLWTDGSSSFTLDMSDALKQELRTYQSFDVYKEIVDQVYRETGSENGIKNLTASWRAFRAE